MKRKYKYRIILCFVTAVIYWIIYLISQNITTYYTYEWVARRILWLFALSSVGWAMSGRVIVAVSSTIGCILGIILGDTIGYYFYIRELERYKIIRSTENNLFGGPIHYGWLICMITYLISIGIGLIFNSWGARIREKKHSIDRFGQ